MWFFPQPSSQGDPNAAYPRNPFSRKFCGCMALRSGCAIACVVWAAVSIYIASMVFIGASPLFPSLDDAALRTMAGLAIVFALIAIFVLICGLFMDNPISLRAGFIALMFIVLIFLLDFSINCILFAVQHTRYLSWCLEYSQQYSSETAYTMNGSSITNMSLTDFTDKNYYNCQKLYEDEVKFSFALTVVMVFVYIYWTTCVYHYYEKQRYLHPEVFGNFHYPHDGGHLHHEGGHLPAHAI